MTDGKEKKKMRKKSRRKKCKKRTTALDQPKKRSFVLYKNCVVDVCAKCVMYLLP